MTTKLLKAGSKVSGILCFSLLLVACSKPDRSELEPKVEYYSVTQRKSAPEPVYSRVTWSHLPAPLPSKKTEKSPLMLPAMAIDLPDATLPEAVEAIAQAMGFRWVYPAGLPSAPVSIRMEGSVHEVLAEVARQAGVDIELDVENRIVRAHSRATAPKL